MNIQRILLSALALSAANCTVSEDWEDDSEAMDSLADKRDVPLFNRKNFVNLSSEHQEGDILSLWLTYDGYTFNPPFVRMRCYGEDCENPVAQDGLLTLTRGKSGKKYIKFIGFEMSFYNDGVPAQQSTELIDMYAYRYSNGRLKLRKTFTSRWVTLRSFSDSKLCTRSGGTWDADGGLTQEGECSCPDGSGRLPNNPGTGPASEGYVFESFFARGLGGCYGSPYSTEDGCDTSQGAYRDDDRNEYTGSYCECGYDRYYDSMVDGCKSLE